MRQVRPNCKSNNSDGRFRTIFSVVQLHALFPLGSTHFLKTMTVNLGISSHQSHCGLTCNKKSVQYLQKWEPWTEHVFCFAVLVAHEMIPYQ